MGTDCFVPADRLAAFCRNCFVKAGVPPDAAQVTANNLVFANLRGVDSHGVIRLKIYLDRLRLGSFKPDVVPHTVSDSPSCALLDAGQGLGQVAAIHAMHLAISKAADTGVAWVSVRNSNHFGAASFYALEALPHEMIGFAATNAGPSMAPSGGRQARLGNNPIAIAVPAQKHPPVVFDIATGAAAWGKIFVAQQEKKKIPLSWALDKHGMPTDDPDAAADGGLIQPFGGYKGYGMSLLIDLLTGLLSGGAFSTQVNTLYQQLSEPAGIAHTCVALRIDRFMPVAEFKARVDQLIDCMHQCPPAAGADRIFVPGEIEFEIEQRRKKEGIPINTALRAELHSIALELGILDF